MNASSAQQGAVVQDSKRAKMSSIFSDVELTPKADMFYLRELYLADDNRDKIDLSVGGKL